LKVVVRSHGLILKTWHLRNLQLTHGIRFLTFQRESERQRHFTAVEETSRHQCFENGARVWGNKKNNCQTIIFVWVGATSFTHFLIP